MTNLAPATGHKTAAHKPPETTAGKPRNLASNIEGLARRYWKVEPRPVAFIDCTGGGLDDSGRKVPIVGPVSLGDVLRVRGDLGGSVYLCGSEAAPSIARWVTEAEVEGWIRRRVFSDDERPSGVWEHAQSRRQLRVTVASPWFGSASAEVASEAWRWIGGRIGEVFTGAGLAGSPGATGLDLLARSIPADHVYPSLITEVADEIRDSSGQQRAELVAAGAEVEAFYELDMRFAYAAVCRGLPSGSPTRYVGEEGGDYSARRVLASWEVPAGWRGPGLLPSKADDGSWRWLSKPGEHGRGWLDGSEARLARVHGWRIHVAQTLLWPNDRPDPLRTWITKLLGVFAEVEVASERREVTEAVAKAARSMVRSVVVQAIGQLQGRPQVVTCSAPVAEASAMPTSAVKPHLSPDAKTVLWHETRPSRWPELARPEWCSVIWARTRCRLLEANQADRKVGALHLPPGVGLIGFRGDCLYLDGDPRWPDDGRVGRYRVKTSLGPITVPGTITALDQLRRSGGSSRARAAIERAKAATR